jgi:hypothetical protein
MDRRTRKGAPADGRLSLREWSRTRRVPLSTAHKAAQSGRITRDADGRLDPARADREWYENTRPRVDMRHLEVPGDPVQEAGELEPLTAEQLEQRYGIRPPPEGEVVSLRDIMTVEASLEDLLARELVAALNRAILDIAPRLARPQDGAMVAERLYNALIDGWQATEAEWRRRFPRD